MADVLELLSKRLEEDSIDAKIDTTDEISLKITVDSLGEKEDGVIGMDITRVHIPESEDDENNKDGEDYNYYYFFSALAVNIDEEKIVSVLRSVNALNLESMVGAYGVIEQEGLLYHKHSVRIKADSDSTVDDLYNVLLDVLTEIDMDYERAIETIA